MLIWAAMSNREAHHNVQQFTFSSASPLWRQLPAQWIAGFLITLVMGSGAALRFAFSGDSVGLMAFLSAALFIPSFALALGVWGSSSKLFEIVYVTLWYLGPLNTVPGLDFVGANSAGYPGFYLPLSIALIAFAFFGRARQLRNSHYLCGYKRANLGPLFTIHLKQSAHPRFVRGAQKSLSQGVEKII